MFDEILNEKEVSLRGEILNNILNLSQFFYLHKLILINLNNGNQILNGKKTFSFHLVYIDESFRFIEHPDIWRYKIVDS